MSDSLGTLTRVDLRKYWPNEATAFTPWLARPESLALIAETLGIELELEGQEQRVGPFRADILCKDTSDGSWILIENQIEPTDHGHLGQLITYAAGLSAATVVWIAQTIRNEHRAALDWLNEITGERFRFFGLEIELWQIGESAAAPKFNLVCQPNSWTKEVKGEAGHLPLTASEQLNVDYWTTLREAITQKGGVLRPQKPSVDQWAAFAIGRSNVHLSAILSKRIKRVSAAIVTLGSSAKPYFYALKAEQAQIEAEIGQVLNWEERPDGVESRIALYLENADAFNRADWPRQHEWLIDHLQKLQAAFINRIRSLPAVQQVGSVGSSI